MPGIAECWATGPETGLSTTQVTARLEAAGFESATVEAALEQLLNRGYFYEVNGTIRLTDSQS